MQSKQLTTAAWSIHNDELPVRFSSVENCLHHHLPEKLGLGHSNFFKLDSDLSYIETRYTPGRDLAVLTRMDASEPRMVVTLGLKGNSRYTPSQGEAVVFREGYTSVTTFNSSEGVREYQAGQSITQLRFSIGKRWLEQCFEGNRLATLFDKPGMQLVSHRPMSASSPIAAQLLLNCAVADKAKPLFRHGQTMAILATELGFLLSEAQIEPVKFNQRDREIANLAREILFDEFQNPPSVADLSRRAGTNQCKLKQLFHHFFNTTPYGLLLEIRMQKAFQLLKGSRYSIAMVAEMIGYNHASNFSAAFFKYYGYPPKVIAKQD